jgi:K+-sensing histidine kinase KdpD
MTPSAAPETAVTKPKSLIKRYSWAVLITAAALGVRLLLDPILEFRIAYATFFIAVAISAVLGGWGPGLVSALLGGFAALYFSLSFRRGITYSGLKAPRINLGLLCT